MRLHRRPTLVLLAAALTAVPAVDARAGAGPVENTCVPQVDAPVWCGDGGPARRAGFVHPGTLAREPDGSILVYDSGHALGGAFAAVRRIGTDGIVTRVAGTGAAGARGDGGPATRARISAQGQVAALSDGGFLISEPDHHRVRRVGPDGVIRTVAGTGVAGDAGDGGPAAAAQLRTPMGVAATPDGGYLIADAGDGHVRRVTPGGAISTVAEVPVKALVDFQDGTFAFSVAALPDGRVVYSTGWRIDAVDGVGAVTTLYRAPKPAHRFDNDEIVWALAPRADGTLEFTADRFLNALGADGTVRRLAGYGALRCRYPPDGGSALELTLALPTGLVALPDGSTLVSDWENSRVRLITAAGTQSLFAGGAGSKHRGRCGFGAGETDMDPWGAFELIAPAATRHSLTVRVATTLRARVRLTLRRGRRVVLHATRTVPAGETRLRFAIRLAPGRYQLTIAGSSGRLHASDVAYGVRVGG